mmetsp:Transcript_11498/g.23374  ORF Transcript_11498/g.23374 Transcript_11498/m.23374 type:complete len:83 (-) Transcript_11498:1482-1730(-)
MRIDSVDGGHWLADVAENDIDGDHPGTRAPLRKWCRRVTRNFCTEGMTKMIQLDGFHRAPGHHLRTDDGEIPSGCLSSQNTC